MTFQVKDVTSLLEEGCVLESNKHSKSMFFVLQASNSFRWLVGRNLEKDEPAFKPYK